MTKRGGSTRYRIIKEYAYIPTVVEDKIIFLDYYYSHQIFSVNYLISKWNEYRRSLDGQDYSNKFNRYNPKPKNDNVRYSFKRKKSID